MLISVQQKELPANTRYRHEHQTPNSFIDIETEILAKASKAYNLETILLWTTFFLLYCCIQSARQTLNKKEFWKYFRHYNRQFPNKKKKKTENKLQEKE